MRDVLFLVLVGAFFALAAAYVRGCARVVGEGVTDAPLAADAERTGEAEVTP